MAPSMTNIGTYINAKTPFFNRTNYFWYIMSDTMEQVKNNF
ncbi:hypothetical protein Q7C_320 [Methylophaga frappieri]|uniref:Uncharacterized protein n=1 Tax=Methylophaga frappieri (strain ATCC BAA-2434 / DSM 25690 / JAM7) TaxID=754477 RepID=I1YF05_METFJ|nr:hypothetical protein Q7C_320 [Methylophaga frappieri]